VVCCISTLSRAALMYLYAINGTDNMCVWIT
jgi:hypothetical protein